MRTRLAGQAGFTIIEVMTVVAIIAFLAAVAIPNMTAMIKNSKLRGAASDLFGDLLVARSEAVKRNCKVDVAPSNTGWSGGWTVTSEACAAPAGGTIAATQVAAHPALDSDISVQVNVPAGTASTIVYGSNGRISAGQPQTVIFYNSTKGVWARCLAVDTSGQPRISVDSKGVPANGCN